MSSKKSVLARWDRGVYNKCKARYPNMTSTEISKLLYDSSIVRLEVGLSIFETKQKKKK